MHFFFQTSLLVYQFCMCANEIKRDSIKKQKSKFEFWTPTHNLTKVIETWMTCSNKRGLFRGKQEMMKVIRAQILLNVSQISSLYLPRVVLKCCSGDEYDTSTC